ncbi:MAG: HEAT repeat domain-containing protein [Kiritimatiellae bacterium]|nr:HEAT repeat domain-containing protein [Kiritimatiellia bacterium]
MNSGMDQATHQQYVQRAVALGRAGDPAALPELVQLIKMPSAEIRRLAASAIGKLSVFGADAAAAVDALAPVALRDPHPQAQQYALSALKAYGTAALPHLDDLKDLACNPHRKAYVQKAAASAVNTIQEAAKIADFLNRQSVTYRYDERMRIVDGYAVRPDFYLPEFDVYIEYWGMTTIDYQIGMLKKKKLYQQQGKRLISLYPEDKDDLDEVLPNKLRRYMRIGDDEEEDS